jgi:hypothetical protein
MGSASATAAPAATDAPHRALRAAGRFEDGRQARRVRVVRILFVLGLLSWSSLAGWWATFFYRSVNEVRAATHHAYAADARLFAIDLARPEADPHAVLGGTVFTLAPLPLPSDVRAFPSVPLVGPRAGQAIVVRPEERRRLHDLTRNRYIMLAGEGTLLIGLLFACLVAMYRMLVGEWRLNRQRDSFVHAVTHELKSPLAGLRALLQSLSTIDLPFEQRRGYLELGLGEVQRLDGLVGNILLTSRLESRDWRPKLVEVDLGAVLTRVAERKRLLVDGRGGRLTLELDAPRPLLTDPEVLEIVLENLLDNAVKYALGRPEVTLSARQDGGGVRIEVADHGRGFRPPDAERLFEKFFRTEESEADAVRGTGLGLYLARSLARACGGDLTAASDGPGLGARFTLVLPG